MITNRLLIAVAFLAIGFSNANAAFNFSTEAPVPTGYQFTYDWSGVTAGTPQYTSLPSYDFVSQEMDNVLGVVSLVNYDPTHFLVQLVNSGSSVDILVTPTSVAYTSGATEPLFALVDTNSGTRMLAGSLTLAGMPLALPYTVEGPSGIGGSVPEPNSFILCFIGILYGGIRGLGSKGEDC